MKPLERFEFSSAKALRDEVSKSLASLRSMRPADPETAVMLIPVRDVERLRDALLNIQAMAERGFPIDCAKLAEQCRRALNP
jgi:hypothetical protein